MVLSSYPGHKSNLRPDAIGCFPSNRVAGIFLLVSLFSLGEVIAGPPWPDRLYREDQKDANGTIAHVVRHAQGHGSGRGTGWGTT